MIVAATASPYKFAPAVLEALTGEKVTDGQQAICRLEETTGTKAPRQLAELFSKTERFNTVIAKQQMSDSVENWINTK